MRVGGSVLSADSRGLGAAGAGSLSLPLVMPSRRSRRGFTIVELLMVLLVVGILASMALVRYRAMKERAYVAAMKNDLGQLRIAEEAYWAENQVYTVDQTVLDFVPSSDITVTVTTSDPYAGFEAQAVHAGASAITCQMYVGRAVGSTPSGQVECN